ncbi:hypothetical protein GIB67_008832 [Kingdonia uniflora]|uniref:Uncharacterized protein n=1 Tax=Kingdonia uniflora TaxID=39325 RepID=A0A7J7LV68_9MAGN|nr:hypothetical protein GIB67_008832 [Kingdonia uniflora]
MVSTSGCAKADEVDLVGRLSPVIGVGDEEDIVAELVKYPRLRGARVEYPMGCSQFREFCKAKSSVDGIWGHAFGYREVILVCKTLNGRWATSGSESRITAKDFLKYYAVKYVTTTDGAYLSSSSSRSCFFDLSSAGRVWNDNLLWVSGECLQRSNEEPLELNNRTITKGISYKVSRMESFIDYVAKEGIELELARLNKMPDGPVDMATVSNTIIRNLVKRKAVKRAVTSRSATSDSVDDSNKRRKVTPPAKSQVVLEESVKIVEGVDLRPHFVVENGLMEEQCRSKAREKGVTVVKDEFKKGEKNQFEKSLTREREACQLELEKEREAAALKLKEVRAESVANGAIGFRVYYFSEQPCRETLPAEEKEIVDKEEVEEMEDCLNVAEKTVADNQETIDQEIESLRLRVVDLEGLLEVEKNSSADLQELDVARKREEQTLLYNVEYAEEYEALISQYEDQLDDNVKLSLNLEEAKSQVEDKTATLLSKDLALNQLISELAELKERAASGSRHDAELAEYPIRALNDEISDMKCIIHALSKQLLKREIDLDTARIDLAVSEANFEKLSNSIVGKDLELHNSAQIRDSLITRLDHLKADLRRLKERETKSRADLAEVQAKIKSLVDNLAHVCGNVRWAVQRDKDMNERINQLCARITELEQELRAREIKYEKDLKLELDKRDGEIASGEGSR